jgi:hypothetical protein
VGGAGGVGRVGTEPAAEVWVCRRGGWGGLPGNGGGCGRIDREDILTDRARWTLGCNE